MAALSPEDLQRFETALRELEADFRALKKRYGQVRRDYQATHQVRQTLSQADLPQAERLRLQRQLEALELDLESRLFQWSSLREPFWQVVRFSGLGLLVGWLLRGWAG